MMFYFFYKVQTSARNNSFTYHTLSCHCNWKIMHSSHGSLSCHCFLFNFDYMKSHFLMYWIFSTYCKMKNHAGCHLDSGNIFAGENDGTIPSACQLVFPWVSGDILVAFPALNKALHEFLAPLGLLSQKLPKHWSLRSGHGKLAGSSSPLMFRWLAGDNWN